MSIQYCHKCDKQIDTDNDAEHFEEHDFEEIERAKEVGLIPCGKNYEDKNIFLGTNEEWSNFDKLK